MISQQLWISIKALNWANGLFRLWLVLTGLWEVFVLYHLARSIYKKQDILWALFATTWPLIFLIVVIAFLKTINWILQGLTDKRGAFTQSDVLILSSKRAQEFIKLKYQKITILIVLAAIVTFVTISFSSKNHEVSWRILAPNERRQEGLAIYKIMTPEGEEILLQGPRGASEEDAIKQAKDLYRNNK